MIRSRYSRSVERQAVRLAGAGLLALAGWTTLAQAAGDFQVHGFATQGYVDTTDNRFFGDSEDGSFEFTELGVNASYRALPSVLLSGQLLSRRAGDMYDGSPVVDYALFDWNAHNDQAGAYGLMAGRIKNTLGLYNDTRDVAFTRPSIFLPQQVYFDAVRNLILSADGVQLYGRLYGDHGSWTLNFGIGDSQVDSNVEVSYLGADFAGELDATGPSFVARAEYETIDGAWRFALSGAKVGLSFNAGRDAPIGSGDIDFLYWIASAQYSAERWTLTAEYMEEPIEFKDFGPLVDGRDSTVQGYYLQGSYLLRNDLEWVLRYGEGYTDKDDRSGTRQAAAAAAVGLQAPAHNFFSRDWMVGLRWNVSPNFMLRAEYQWTSGSWTLVRRENPDPAATEKDWEMFSILASYRF